MQKVRVFELLQKRVLVRRGLARELGPEVASALAKTGTTLDLDLSGVRGVTPSFFDELLTMVEESVLVTDPDFRITVVDPPGSLEASLLAVARAHGLALVDSREGEWVISSALTPAP